MATRDSMSHLIQQCEDAIRFAQDQYREGSLQQHYNNDDYTNALQGLEQTYQDVCKMAQFANGQQKGAAAQNETTAATDSKYNDFTGALSKYTNS